MGAAINGWLNLSWESIYPPNWQSNPYGAFIYASNIAGHMKMNAIKEYLEENPGATTEQANDALTPHTAAFLELTEPKYDASGRLVTPSPIGGVEGNIPYTATTPATTPTVPTTPSTWSDLQRDTFGLGSTIGGTDMASLALTEQAYGPYTSYLQSLGLGGGYWNPAQRYQANLYEPMRWLWGAQQPYMAALGQETQPWTSYMGMMGGNMGKIQSQARNLLTGLFGMTPSARQEYGFGFEPQYDPFTGEQMTTTQTGQRSLGELQDLLTYGLSQKYGPMGAGWLAGRVPQMQQQWQSQQAGGAPGMPFMDYLRQRYGI